MSVVRQWLPPAEAEAALQEDPRRFAAVFSAVRASWDASKTLDPSLRSLKTLEWLALVRSLETEVYKSAVDSATVNAAVELMLDIILSSETFLAARTRWAELLNTFLQDFCWKVTISIPWRPFYEILGDFYKEPNKKGFSGPLVAAQEVEQMVTLARRSRRFFPPGSAAEIWQEVRPLLADPRQPDAYLGLGWLALLLPTRQVTRLDADWNAWLAEWMSAWDSIVHSNFWDALWLTLLSRLAKHDTAGAIDWKPHLERIFTKCSWAFQVPVGTASAAPPFGEEPAPADAQAALAAMLHSRPLQDESQGRRPPNGVSALFNQITTKRSPKVAKLLLWLLGRVHEAADPEDLEGQDAVLLGLERLGSLLEQYYHPSNNGKWTSTLAHFLERLTRHFRNRVSREQSPGGATERWSSDEEEEAPAAQPPGGRALAAPRAPLSDEAQQRVARLIVKLASKAQYAKDRDMVSKACFALASMSPWVPDLVLPLVHSRFLVALEAVTAAHQLNIAVHTLGLCVRPLLLAGLSPSESPADMMSDDGPAVSPRVAVGEALAAAMNATLPGIDANDDRKTRAVFRFYCVVLSSVGNLPAGESPLPLYTEEWLDELLARIFAILSNLDSPETRSDLSTSGPPKADHDCQSFLLNDDCMFRPMIELLLARLPADLRTHAIKRIARFVTSTTLPSVAGETGILCSVPSWIAPKETALHLAQPLLARIEAELPVLQKAATAPGGMHISKVQETSLKWQLSLLACSLFSLGSHALPLKARLLHVFDTLLTLPSQRIASGAAAAMSSLLRGLLGYYPCDEAAAVGFLPGTEVDGVPTEAWISIDGRVPASLAEDMRPTWHVATADEVAFGEELVQRHLVGAARELKAYCSGGLNAHAAGAEKDVVRTLLFRMQQSLNGVRTCLPDFQHDGPDLPGEDLAVHARAGVKVGTPRMRHEAAEALLAACRHNFSDPDIQQHIMEVTDEILSTGFEEHAEASSNLAAWKADDALLHEDRSMSRMTKQPGKWRIRRPRWMQVLRVQLLLMNRVAEAAYRPQMTSQYPKPPLGWVPSIFKELCAEMLRYALQNYKVVATSADAGLRRAAKRYPCLIPALLPTLLSALGSLPLPSQEDVLGGLQAGPEAKAGTMHIDLKLLRQLNERAATSAAQSASTADATAADLSVEEGRVGGSLALLSSPAIWRAWTRELEPTLAMMAAILASSSHRSPNTMAGVSNTFVLFLLRFLRPAGLDSPEMAQQSAHLQLMVQHLLRMGAAAPAMPVHWRFSLMANGLLLMLAPPTSPQSAELLARHFWPLIQHQLAPQRTLAGIYLTSVLSGKQAWKSAEMVEATRIVIREGLAAADPDWGHSLMELFSLIHPNAPVNLENGSTQNSEAGKSRDDMLVKLVGLGLLKHLEWPEGRPSPSAVRDASFNLGHVLFIKALTEADPEHMIAALKGTIVKALTGVPQREERPMTLQAIECLTALIGSGALFTAAGPGGSAWEEWAEPLLTSALSAAPLDFGEVWATALRFAVHCLAEQSPAGFEQLLAVIGQPVAQDASSVTLTKWLKMVGHTLAELSSCEMHHRTQSPVSERVKSSSQAFQRRILAALPALTQSVGETVRKHVASCTVVLLAGLLYQERGALSGVAEAPSGDVTGREVQAYLDHLVKSMEEGAAVIAAAERQAGPDADGQAAAMDGAGLLQSPAVARLGTALQVINQALRGGEGTCAVPLRLTLLRMLPSLLRIQEMAAPELQPLALEAKSGAAVLKYLPVTATQVAQVVSAVEAVSHHDQWPARAAALVFVQYFWFRNIFLMSPPQSTACQQLVVRLMRDGKLEVQEMAASTLAGMLKGLSEPEFHTLQSDLVAQANRLFPKSRKRGAAAGSGAAAASPVEKHAVVLGLKALVLCTPYDVPAWLPESLMALVQAATQPAPIKSTVSKAFSEFKRTHEEAGLAEAKRMLTSDQWDAIQGIASPASYFA